MNTLLVATTNKGKLAELKEIMRGSGFELIDLTAMKTAAPDVLEDGTTFEENALKKAREYSAFYNLPTVADDSGLEVTALDNRPGVYSARYADTDAARNEKLLHELALKHTGDRSARFVSVAAYVDASQQLEHVVRGSVEGYITTTPAGDRGFGFDPVFYYPPLKKTFAQLSMDEKNGVSHRKRAFSALKEWLISQQKSA